MNSLKLTEMLLWASRLNKSCTKEEQVTAGPECKSDAMEQGKVELTIADPILLLLMFTRSN